MSGKTGLDMMKYYVTMEHFITVDIGTFGVKVMEVKRKFTEYSIERIFYLPEMGKYFKGKDMINVSGIVDNIIHMLQVEEIKAKTMILTFTSSKLQSKIIRLPDISEKDIKSFVEIEFQKQFPNTSRLSDTLDYMPVGKMIKEDQIGSMVLIGTLPITEATNIIKEVEAKKVFLKTIDSDVHALGNVGRIHNSDHVERVVFDIGSETSNLVFIHDNATVFSRPISYGITNLVKALQSEEDLLAKDAERIVEEVGLIATEDVLVKGYRSIGKDTYNEIIEESLSSALNEAYRTFQFANSNIGVDVDEVILTGGFSCLPGSVEFSKSILDLNVVRWIIEKEQIIPLPNGCRITNNTGRVIDGTYATCFGMAIRGTLV